MSDLDRHLADAIEAKYFVQNPDAPAEEREELKQNLQADLNKLDGIIRKITEKKAPVSELSRLRATTTRLLGIIDFEIERQLS